MILSVFDELPVSGRLMRGFHGSGLHVTHVRKAPFPAWCEKLWSGACFRFLVSACQGPCQICHEEHRTGTWRQYLLARSISSYCASLLCVWPQDLLLLILPSELILFFTVCSSDPVPVHLDELSDGVSENVPSGRFLSSPGKFRSADVDECCCVILSLL